MSKGDFRHLVDVNAQPEVKALVSDLRGAVCQVDYQASAKNIFYLLKYTDTGAFIIVLRTIPDILGNYLAAWIFAPYSCKISDRDLCSAVEFVSEKVAGPSLNNQIFGEIRKLFGHEYEEDPLAPVFAPTDGKAFAYRYYNGNTGTALADLIGRFRYQPCYLPFAGVLLVDSAVSDNVSGTNLTSAPKETMAVLFPPDTAGADGYSPTIYACPFDVPYFAPMDRTFDIIWRKKGEPNVKQPVTVSKSEMQAPAFEEYTRPVRAYDDSIKAEAQKATATKKVEKADAEEEEEEDSEIITKPAKPANYEYDDEPQDESIFDKYSDAINKALYAVGGFLLGVVATLMFTCSSEDEPIATPHPYNYTEEPQPTVTNTEIVDAASAISTQPEHMQEQAAAQPEAQTPEQPQAQTPDAAAAETAKPETTEAPKPDNSTNLKAAVKYLDTHTTWTKKEMDKYPDLKGLYEDLNKVDRKSIINKWGPKLKDSKKFKNLVTHAKYSKKKKARRVPYNKGKSSSIALQDYLNNMDP